MISPRSTPFGTPLFATLLALAIIAWFAPYVNAATVAGRVRDANTNSFVLGATVVIRELGRQVTTDPDGTFRFHDVPAGNYTVVTSYLGYADVSQPVDVSTVADRHVDIAIGAEIVQLGALVVEGNREGQARALQQKRSADNIMDVVSADSTGKLPDGNAAEAVRRLPGVFAEIDQNEGRYIVVRGIDANLNNITINGISVGSTESGGRGAGMDSVPADLISRIEVVKAVTPNMDHQAIGASVNIVTPSAFDREGTFAYGTLAGGYFSGPSSDLPYSGSATYGTTFGDGKWGVVVGASYSYRHYISNRRSGGNPWFPAGPAGTAGANIFFPATQALFHYDVQRWRMGANATLEFRPSLQNQFALRISDNRFKDEEGREQNAFEFFRTAFPDSFTPTSATFTGGRSTVEYRYYKQKHNITNISFEGKHDLRGGGTKLDYNLAVGDAAKKTPDRQDWEFRSGTNLASTLDTSAEYWIVTPQPSFYSASTFPFRRVRFRSDVEDENNLAATLNLKRERQIFGRDGFWQVGAKFFNRDKEWNRTNVDYNAGTGANLFHLGQFNVLSAAREMFDGRFQMSPQINLKAIQAFFRESPQYFVPNPAGTLANSYVTDFGFEERIIAGYAMSRVNFGALSALGGVRVEGSKGDVSQTELPTAGSTALDPRLNHFSKTYTNVLPGIHLRYALQKNWIWRASWTNTLGRPNYPDMAGSAAFVYSPDAVGSSTYTGSITSGNPDLKPYESSNLDLTSEYYLRNSGIISISAFDKRVENPVFTNAYTLRNTTYAGLTFSSLSYSRPENATSGKIRGVEFNYQQQLSMLPSPFDGLGFSVNYTITDSEERLFTRPTESLRFAKQADNIYNAALFYEKYGFQARIAYTFTGDFIKAFGTDVNSDMYQSERKIVDAKISYRLTKKFTVFADVINLGEEPLDEYAGFPNRNQATEKYWWTANFGVHWKL
jgi:TonB-dependent receptor